MACTLKTYRTCNLTIGFSKHEFNKNLLSNVTLIRVTSNVTWMRERERESNVGDSCMVALEAGL